MLVSFIIPTYNRLDLLRATLSSLIAQSVPDLEAIVIIDDLSSESLCMELITSLFDNRISYRFTECRYNDWGHTPREMGKQMANGDYIILTNDDNYYTPNLVEEIVEASKTNPGVIYWNMVHSHYNYQYFYCRPAFNQIDMGAFATRSTKYSCKHYICC